MKLMVLPIGPKVDSVLVLRVRLGVIFRHLWPPVAYHTPPQAPKHTIYDLYTLLYAYTSVWRCLGTIGTPYRRIAVWSHLGVLIHPDVPRP